MNDLNLPHLEDIASAFLHPARRNGDFLLIRILGEAGIYTLREAVLGFTMGVLLGFVLGTLFAHSKLMERALLPYAVASQTVPILAIAPMVDVTDNYFRWFMRLLTKHSFLYTEMLNEHAILYN